jgi:hypothetical protein
MPKVSLQSRLKIKLLTFLSAVSLAGACVDASPESMYENYLYRLGNVTGVDAPDSPAWLLLPAYPRKRDLVLTTEDVRIGFVTYFDLADCDLLQEVSERNSSLGRVQPVTARLIYEMRFYQKISRCDEKLQKMPGGDADFKNQIANVRRIKGADLPKVFWNATFASPEFAKLLGSAPPLRRDEPASVTDIEFSLALLTRIGAALKTSPPPVGVDELERHYFRLQAGNTLGKLLQGLRLSHSNLLRASRMLKQAADTKHLCPHGKKTRKGEYLFNVFVKYYAGEVQPYLSRLHQATGPLLAAVDSLRRVQTAEVPEAFSDYYAAVLDPVAPQGLWQHFNQALREHTQAWQTVLKQCDLMPSAPIGRAKEDGLIAGSA